MNRKVAVILINWNSFEYTNNCIISLQEMSYTDYDIILVDNDSKDNSGEALNQRYAHQLIFIKSNENLGFTGGNNLGIQYAIENGYEYVLFLNNDTFVKKDFLGILVDYMDRHAETGAIQPRIYFNHNRSWLWNGGSSFNLWLGHASVIDHYSIFPSEIDKIKQVDWITGCAFLTRTAILSKAGMFAGNMFMYYEDLDLSFRIKQLGYPLIYHPNSVIYHIAGSSNKQKIKGKEGYVNPVVHYMYLRNRIWLLKKYTPWYCMPGVFLFTALYIFAVMVYFAARLRFVKFRTVIKAVKDGLRGHIIYK